ncbi:MAG: hypothetical protein HYY23_17200 [Verrucomicrobia bacterium]|nr:hypothetical protein [Verrucomicrobiota bacterium]
MKVHEHSVFLILTLSLLVAFGSIRDSIAADAPKKLERPRLYDTTADGNKQIAAALKEAKAEQKRVILKFGANW